MLVPMGGKPHVYSVRLTQELNDRLQRIKAEQAHKRVPNSEFLEEAVKLYVALAESFGIDENLMIPQQIGSYRPTGTAVRGHPSKAKRSAKASNDA